jgi:hypothetical protein
MSCERTPIGATGSCQQPVPFGLPFGCALMPVMS